MSALVNEARWRYSSAAFRELARRRGASTRSLARRLGIDERHLSRSLGIVPERKHGRAYTRKTISYELAAKLCRALDVDPVDMGV